MKYSASIIGCVLILASCGKSEPQAPKTPNTWIKPASITLTCEEWAEVPHGNAVYFNNVWNKQAAENFEWRQCIERDPADKDRLGWSWHWPADGDDIYAQPQAKIGASPWLPELNLDARFPVRLSDLAAMTVATDVEVHARGEFNLVNTLWLTDTGDFGAEPRPDSIVAEIMIWTYATKGQMDPAGKRIATVEDNGKVWDIWLNENWHDVSGVLDNRWIYLAFVARNGSTSALFDPVALLRSEELAHLGLDDAYIADVEFGSEIMRGDGLIWVNRFVVEMQWN